MKHQSPDTKPIDWAELRDEALGGLTHSLIPPKVNLPTLPGAVTSFAKRSLDETVSLRELAGILETDAGLTLRLLKHVNSAFVGVQGKVKSVVQALSLLGCVGSRRFVLVAGMEAAIRAHNSKLINQNSFWNTNLQKAIFSREIALLLETDAEIAFLGALLQDYVLPVLTNDLFDEYSEFVESSDVDAGTLAEFERHRFGWDHGLVGACLAYNWKLPDELVCCIRYHHSGLGILTDAKLGRSPVAATALSSLLPDRFSPGRHGLALLRRLEGSWPAFRLERLAESVDQQYSQMSLGIHNAFPLLPLCANQGNTDSDSSIGTAASIETVASSG
jgi:HD-like signal output (HDOD) protein